MMLDFPSGQLLVFISGFLFLVGAAIFFEWNKAKASLFFLLTGGFLLGCFVAALDPYLIVWDEQYHALVAKNLLENFLKPTLYNQTVLDYNYQDWSNNHIWLHKQPLFLWQMAVSMKLFGINEFVVRLPSVIMHALLPLLIYRIGKIASSEKAGFYGALFFVVAYFPLELVAGKFPTDHNDIAFLFYVSAGFWAWFEYIYSQKKYWLVLIGLFSGCAVLVKWLTGLLIYAAWFTGILCDRELRIKRESYAALFKSLFIACVIFIPWQLYIRSAYPVESADVFGDNLRHFLEVVDAHGGTGWFHIQALRELYGHGEAIPFLILVSLVVLYKKTPSSLFRIVIFFSLALVYIFYTIAKTKMISYCIIVSPFVFIALGALFEYVFYFIGRKINRPRFIKIISCIAIITVCIFLFDFPQVRHYHTMWKPKDNLNRQNNLNEMEIIRRLPSILHDKKYVLFNPAFSLNAHIAIMFYTDYIAYNFVPTPNQLKTVHSKGYSAAIFNMGALPDYILQNDSIIKINVK